jgi:hypothetical protein
LLQVAGDGIVDPRQDDTVRLEPRGALGEHLIIEHVASQRVLVEDGEEYPAPLGVGVRGLVEDDGDERLHVFDGGGLRPDGFMGGFILGEGLYGKATVLGSLGRAAAASSMAGASREPTESARTRRPRAFEDAGASREPAESARTRRPGGTRGCGGEQGARGVREDEEARRRARDANREKDRQPRWQGTACDQARRSARRRSRRVDRRSRERGPAERDGCGSGS